MEIATNAPSTAGPWVVTLAISSAVAGSSVTCPLSHRTIPPPTSAARYDAVSDLEPLQLAQPSDPPGVPHLPQDARHALRNATEPGVTLDCADTSGVHLESRTASE